MEKKNGFAISESDRRLIRENAYFIREALFSCMTEAQVECSVAFARYLNRFGINSENYWLFLRLVMTNNPWVIDELLHDREARLLFSTIRPEAELIEAAFQTLYSRHPEELYPRALEALLGIVESSYFDPDDGYRIRKLSIMDINALGKFLLKGEPQENPLNRLILEILDRITHLNEYYQEQDKSVLSKHAFNVRYAYFDRTRDLVDAIPHPLLVRVPDHGKVRPEEDYVDLVAARRARKRDSSGRFVRERPTVAPSGEAEKPIAPAQPAAPAAVAPPAAVPEGPSARGADATPPPAPKPKPARAGTKGAPAGKAKRKPGDAAKPPSRKKPKG
ncbi:MAG: hypothetical protein JNG85_16065 [Spirochaetaceae bacterium]|nr:hypothetical protein [Spirochaetaceae bacterium]